MARRSWSSRMADNAAGKRGGWPAILGLGLLAFPTAFDIGAAISIRYYRWLWNVPPPNTPHGELRGLSASAAFTITWQAALLLAVWLLFWWMTFVRRSRQPLWADQRALNALAIFAAFTAAMVAWVMIIYPESLY